MIKIDLLFLCSVCLPVDLNPVIGLVTQGLQDFFFCYVLTFSTAAFNVRKINNHHLIHQASPIQQRNIAVILSVSQIWTSSSSWSMLNKEMKAVNIFHLDLVLKFNNKYYALNF